MRIVAPIQSFSLCFSFFGSPKFFFGGSPKKSWVGVHNFFSFLAVEKKKRGGAKQNFWAGSPILFLFLGGQFYYFLSGSKKHFFVGGTIFFDVNFF